MRFASITVPLFILLLAIAGCAESDGSEKDAETTTTASTTGETDAEDLPQIFQPSPKKPDRSDATLTEASTSQQIELAPATLMDYKVSIKLPLNMNPMTPEQLEAQYAGATRPDVAYTDPTTAIDLTMTHTDVALQPPQIYEYHYHFKSELKKAPNTKHAQWISNEEVTVDGRRCFLAQFRNQLTDQEVYNMVLGLSLDERLLLVTFNFPTALEDTWLDIGKEMLLTADFHDSAERGASGSGAAASQ